MSNILSKCFLLMNEVKDDPLRSDLKETFDQLHKADLTSGSIGYYGRHVYKQFLGYLSIYSDRERINRESPIKIPDLPEAVINCLTYGHSYIQSINSQCLLPLADLIPASELIVNPYWIYESKQRLPTVPIQTSEAQMSLLQSFQLSKPFKIIRNRLEIAPKLAELKEQDVANAVYSILERIKQFGLKNCPEDLFAAALKINQRTPESILSAIVISLICIHSSLQVIDQLIFQAFVSDRFRVLDESNIFSVSHMGSNGLSDILEVKSDIDASFPGDIIVIELPYDELPEKKRFCLVESIQMNISQEFGNENITGARCVDSAACLYPNLARNLELI